MILPGRRARFWRKHGLDDLSVVRRHQNKQSIYLELMQKATPGRFSRTRSGSSQRTQHSHSNKHRSLPPHLDFGKLQLLVHVVKPPTLFFMSFSSKQNEAGKSRSFLRKQDLARASPAFMVIRISYLINGSPVRRQLKNLPVVMHVSSF